MRAYHRVDPLMDERKGHYTPAQLGAFLKVQLLAGRQTARGRFRSVAALRALLPSAYVKHVAFLLAEGDLDVLTDGTVYVDGWNEWQEGDLTVGERMRAIRTRGRGSDPWPDERKGMSQDRGTGADRTAAWRLRTQVFERDGYICRYCLSGSYPRGWLVADHVIPEPEGLTTLENLVTACRPCNSKKGGRTPEQAGMILHPAGDALQTPSRDSHGDKSPAIRSSVGVGVGFSGETEVSPATRETLDGRADLEAFLVIRRRAPTPKQRRLLDEVLDRHDLTGAAWAADVMYRHPDDPIGAVIEADKEWRAERIAEAQAAEKPKPKPRRCRGLPQSTREIMAEMAALRREPA